MLNQHRRIVRNSNWILATAFLLTIIVYSFAMPGEFVYDDIQQVQQLGLQQVDHLMDIVFNGLRQIRVWQNLSFALNWQLSPHSALSYKIFNLLLHLLNGSLLFLWLKRLLGKKYPLLPALSTAIFILHPLQIQSVSYVMGRAGLLQAFFFLFSLWYFSKYALTRIMPLCLILSSSLLAKETCILIPILLLCYETVLHQTPLRKLFWPKWGLLLGVPLLWIPLYILLKDPVSMYTSTTGFGLYDFWYYCASQFYFLVFYFYQFATLSHQSIIHSFPAMGWFFVCGTLLGIALFITLIYCSVKYYKKLPLLSFVIFLFFLSTFPTFSFFQVINPYAEYRLYLSNISLSIAAGFLLMSAAIWIYKQKESLFIQYLFCFLLLGGLACATLRQARVWRSAIAINQQGVSQYPQEALLWNNLAAAYLEQNRFDEAYAAYKMSQDNNPDMLPLLARNLYLLAVSAFHAHNAALAATVLQDMEADTRYKEKFPPQFEELKNLVNQELGKPGH